MRDKVFVDTNVWIYAVLESSEEKHKHEISSNLIKSLISEGNQIVIGTQVVNEVYVNLLKNVPEDKALQICDELVDLYEIKSIDSLVLRKAWDLNKQYKFSYWDSLIGSAAVLENCKSLYSEDMQDGLVVETRLKIVNPFRVLGYQP